MTATSPSASVEQIVARLCEAARAAAPALARVPAEKIDAALERIAVGLEARKTEIFAANALDLESGKAKGLSGALLDRLAITEKTLASMASGVRQVKTLPNPLGEELRDWTLPNALHIHKVRVPIGVIGIIYESRPNVTIDASVLCIKTGNAVILRGGSEAFHTNTVLASVLKAGLEEAGLPADAAQIIPTTDREAIGALCRQDKTVDLLIPRGGHGLIETVVSQARMPVIKHFHGVCHVYVHEAADFAMAEEILINAKVQRPGVCNAAETVLVDRAIAAEFVPRIVARLRKEGVEIRGDAEFKALGKGEVNEATEESWSTEYLDLIISARVVGDLTEAVAHIEKYGSRHSDAIVTKDDAAAKRFFREVDSATVYWNASTRFTDGAQFGFGAEIGISTDKIHARGPMALEELTSYKYLIEGNGQVRA